MAASKCKYLPHTHARNQKHKCKTLNSLFHLELSSSKILLQSIVCQSLDWSSKSTPSNSFFLILIIYLLCDWWDDRYKSYWIKIYLLIVLGETIIFNDLYFQCRPYWWIYEDVFRESSASDNPNFPASSDSLGLVHSKHWL